MGSARGDFAQSDQSGHRLGGRPVLPPLGCRLESHWHGHRPGRRGRSARRQHDIHADGKEPVPVEFPQLRAQGAGNSTDLRHRVGLVQIAYSRDLPQHRRVGSGRVRRRSCRTLSFQKERCPAHPPTRRRGWPQPCQIRSAAMPAIPATPPRVRRRVCADGWTAIRPCGACCPRLAT